MRMKQITAPTMQEALHIARRDLGDEAVLLETRKLSGGRGVTVVFAVDEEEENSFAHPTAANTKIPPIPVNIPSRTFNEEISHKPRAKSVPATSPTATSLPHPAHDLIAHELLAHAMPEELAERMMQTVRLQKIPSAPLQDAAETLLSQALSTHLKFHPIHTGDKHYPARALMFIGPHGAGKTSTIAKLATQLTLAKKRVVLISTDMEHMGAAEAMQALSDLLKCELHRFDKRALLREMVKQTLGDAWVLIDSAGVNIYEFAQMKKLGELAGLQGIEPILTCPAGMDAEEAQEMAGVFSFLPIERVIVTRTDATRRLSSLFSVLSAGGYALSNMTSSTSPSDACTAMSAPALSRLILRRARERVTH